MADNMDFNVKNTHKNFIKKIEGIKSNELGKLISKYDLMNIFDFFQNEILTDNKEDIHDVLSHTKDVVWISSKIIEKTPEVLSKDEKYIIYCATILHDIAKYKIEGRKHSDKGVEFLKNDFNNKNFNMSDEQLEVVNTLVFHHNRTKKINGETIIDPKLLLLTKIVHDSDKTSKILKKKTWKHGEIYFEREKLQENIDYIPTKLIMKESKEILSEIMEAIKY